jgi:hypothetical protein
MYSISENSTVMHLQAAADGWVSPEPARPVHGRTKSIGDWRRRHQPIRVTHAESQVGGGNAGAAAAHARERGYSESAPRACSRARPTGLADAARGPAGEREAKGRGLEVVGMGGGLGGLTRIEEYAWVWGVGRHSWASATTDSPLLSRSAMCSGNTCPRASLFRALAERPPR